METAGTCVIFSISFSAGSDTLTHMIAKLLVILILVAGIVGGTGYVAFELYFKEKKLDIQEKKILADAPPPTPPPDPSIAAFEKLKPVLAQETPDAKATLEAYLTDYPESAAAQEVRVAIGRINTAQVLSAIPSPDKTVYTVTKGDSLVKIAAKNKTGADLIHRVNKLQTINLQIGQQLVIPKLDLSLVIDRKAHTLTVNNAGVFFKEYVPKSFKLPGGIAAGKVETKVVDRLAMKGTARIAFGAKEYEESDRSIVLAVPGLIIRGVPAPAADGTETPMPSGIVLDPADAAELFAITARGTPVTIK